jgi:hypothetical protein
MSTPREKAAAYLLKLEADRAAALAASEEKVREAMLIKAREDGFREAMEVFGLTVTSHDAEGEPERTHREVRRDIRELIIKELSFSGKAMTKHQIARAINYIPERTEAALKRLETAGIVQNRDDHWEVVVSPAVPSNGHAPGDVSTGGAARSETTLSSDLRGKPRMGALAH